MFKKSGFSLLLASILMVTILTACNSSNSNSNDLQENQVGEVQFEIEKERPFDKISSSEFFLVCELSGGKIQEWEEGWTCNYEDEEDILCNQLGECVFGQAPEIISPTYSSATAILLMPEETQDLNQECENQDGTFFEWDSGFGCDFEEEPDIFCDFGDNCGFGWVLEIVGTSPLQSPVTGKDTPIAGNGLIASFFQPAFISTTAENDLDLFEPTIDPALAIEIFFNSKIDFGTIADGSSDTFLIAGDDDPDVEIEQCDAYGCYLVKEDETEAGINFSNFQAAFINTEVYFLLAGTSDIEPTFSKPGTNWNGLYEEVVGRNGIVGQNGIVGPTGLTDPESSEPPIPIPYPNLPGTVSIITPNNGPFNFADGSTLFDEADALFGKRALVLVSNPFGNSLSNTLCGLLRPPLCFPDIGLYIPATQLNYYINSSYLSMPVEFTWEEKSSDSTISEIVEVSDNLVTTDDLAHCRVGPATFYNILRTLEAGEVVKVLGRNAGGNWVFVELNDGLQCYLWEGILGEDSDFEDSEILTDPATPTPQPTATVEVPAPSVGGSGSGSDSGSGTGSVPPPADPQKASISGTVYKDIDGNGFQNPNDSGYSGIALSLDIEPCGPSNRLITTTNGSGGYSFTGLDPGNYCLTVYVANICNQYSINTTGGKSHTIGIISSFSFVIDFGFKWKNC